ncbi:MAG: DUF502 domain-containing protein [Pirellulaceae bacterium]
MNQQLPTVQAKSTPRPSQRAVLRGLGVVLPPLLTIVILVWIFNTVQDYVLVPIESGAKHTITWFWYSDQTLKEKPADAVQVDARDDHFEYQGKHFVSIAKGTWIPVEIYQTVADAPSLEVPQTAQGYFHRYIELKYLKRSRVLPIFFVLFILLLYLLGRFLAYGIGRVMYKSVEQIITQLPIIRTVYTSVKQVTDFVFSDNELEFNRVVAVEYPRKGIWSLGFVTGDSMLDIRNHAGEPVISILIPTSPMPATGYTITVLRSETIDLDITMDQAFQFIVSCGVVVPMGQRQNNITNVIHQAIEGRTADTTSG